MRAAVLDNRGYVVNIIVADAAVDTLHGFTLVDITNTPNIDFGYMYVDSAFTLTPERQAEIEAEEAAAFALVLEEAWEETA